MVYYFSEHNEILLERKTTICPTQLFLLRQKPIYVERRKKSQNQVPFFFSPRDLGHIITSL